MARAIIPHKTRLKCIVSGKHYGRVGTAVGLEGPDEVWVEFSDGECALYGREELRVVYVST